MSPEDWAQGGFAGSDLCELPIEDNGLISREHAAELSVEQFIQEYEKQKLPVVIDGVPTDQKWSAVDNWTIKSLKKNFRHGLLKCGEDDDGNTIRMKLKYFLKYMKTQVDDSPLYIFDSSFDDRKDTTPLLADYSVPKYFPDDLFELVGESKRPPYRWFLVGPKRSGTCVHIDPLGTSAWNTLIVGRKRWVLFPPHVAKNVAKGKEYVYKGEDDEACNYFGDILPRLKKNRSKHNLRKKHIIEFMQYPGETVFVPGGWWHAVLNVEDSIAVTQNFCSKTNFEDVWKKTRSGRKRMSVKWLRLLEEKYPELAKKAHKLNIEDGFVMYSKEEKKDKKKKKKKRALSSDAEMKKSSNSMSQKKNKN